MASAAPSAGLDTMITVKLQIDGITRRTKMPLRDMVPKTLESNIRTFLHTPPEIDLVLDRYSDSAASYVQLERDNVSIYKQLYRAAKAKSKLKIRVTPRASPQKPTPKPVTIEDEPEASSSTAIESPQESQVNISPAPTPTADAPAPTLSTLDAISAAASLSAITLPFRTCPDYQPPVTADGKPIGRGISTREDFETRLANLFEHQSGLASRLATQQAEHRARRAQQASGCCGRPAVAQPTISRDSAPPSASPASAAFAICCNHCEKTIPDVHYHCSTCDDGDFDLCQACVEQGITCHGKDHWLIKRTTVDGRLVRSITETIAPKPKAKEQLEQPKVEEQAEKPKPVVTVETKIETKSEPKIEPKDEAPSLPKPEFEPLIARWASLGVMRTCNCCVQELPEVEFLHCNTCEDYDLCQPCVVKNAHGHHPQHGFVPAVKGTEMPHHVKVKMVPGRNQMHHAICDGCDKYIAGVRHKCLDCPDWDYCANCIKHSKLAHPNHRFVPIYEHLADVRVRSPTPVHIGICCDGPLCAGNEAYPAYVRGTRYKCAVCNDTDFCANCEASPSNTHNKTHPMIMFKTPVRHVSVTTTGEHQGGHRMPTMGDRVATNSKATETVAPAGGNTINPVQTIVDVKPSQTAPAPFVKKAEAKKSEIKKAEVKKAEVKEEKKEIPASEEPLVAVFVSDTTVDGTVLPANHVFEQTWLLRNEGNVAWPAGCSVKFVGGDYMGHVDPNHPAGISELVSASESTVCYPPLAPGQEFPFTVLLRTPARAGKIVSYWRLTSPSGEKFGHRLWCDVNVRIIKSEVKSEPKATSEPEVKTETVEKADAEDSQASSQMIFPKLEKESPVASIHEAAQADPAPALEQVEVKESGDEDWDLSDDGFMTDEEYDILDASDEEYLEEQKKKVVAK
ncbi:hypothetical protein AK830_g10603 [Neonectria ditissima]|uniref:ZZ-type domain-containing protein n=1 Tax=Neonectria ditissima TaxID=78410 RepID=A0A0P7AT67_9HYPO|nr:hypothetical protein AK830_g10603 [Neonectria ditissima]